MSSGTRPARPPITNDQGGEITVTECRGCGAKIYSNSYGSAPHLFISCMGCIQKEIDERDAKKERDRGGT